LKKLVDTYTPKVTPEEQSYIDNECNQLCAMISDDQVTSQRDFTKEAWDFMRDKKFFGLKIPKEWGGLGFSTQAVSVILAKLAVIVPMPMPLWPSPTRWDPVNCWSGMELPNKRNISCLVLPMVP
jgi:alkylation response protein AidB-like acyl-CoA dehydrogenase